MLALLHRQHRSPSFPLESQRCEHRLEYYQVCGLTFVMTAVMFVCAQLYRLSTQPLPSLLLPLWAGVECVCECVSSLTGYCYRELSQTEHAPSEKSPCGWHGNREAAVKLLPSQSAGRCCGCTLATLRHLINP